MIVVDCCRGKRVAVFGLARSGLATGRSLQAGGAQVFCWDDQDSARAAAKHAGLEVQNLNEIDWTALDALVISPGVPLTHPQPHPLVEKARRHNVEVIGDVELFFRALAPHRHSHGPHVICVTGTNGKSTTTALIGHVLQQLGFDVEVGGNIGRAVLEMAPPQPARFYVLELSSFQIDLTPSLRPDVGVLINITPDHLDRHGTIEHYAEVKSRLFALQTATDMAVVGIDDELSEGIFQRVAQHVHAVPVSVGKVTARGVFAADGKLIDAMGARMREVGPLHELSRLPGAHNWQNAAMAYAAVLPFVKNHDALFPAMTSFPGLVHRIEYVGEIDGVAFYNDSKATNADATARALACFEKIHWIAGGKAKAGGIRSLNSFFPRVAHAYLIGAAAEEFADSLKGLVPAHMSGTLETAMRAALQDAAHTKGVVLLSPACASFDQFRDFEHRGDEFKRIFNVMESEAHR